MPRKTHKTAKKRAHHESLDSAIKKTLPPDHCIPCSVVFNQAVGKLCRDRKRRS